MAADVIERETFINAPVDRVWSFVVVPGFWVDHSGSLAETEVAEGATFTAHEPEHGDYPLEVVAVDPPRAISYRWACAFPGEAPREGNSTLIEFTLVEQGAGTLLRVVESGFESIRLGGDKIAEQYDGNSKGWEAELDALRERAEATV